MIQHEKLPFLQGSFLNLFFSCLASHENKGEIFDESWNVSLHADPVQVLFRLRIWFWPEVRHAFPFGTAEQLDGYSSRQIFDKVSIHEST